MQRLSKAPIGYELVLNATNKGDYHYHLIDIIEWALWSDHLVAIGQKGAPPPGGYMAYALNWCLQCPGQVLVANDETLPAWAIRQIDFKLRHHNLRST